MKTLVVKYLPTGANSQTKRLLDLLLKEIRGREVDTLDLLTASVPNFSEASMAAYIKRNYMKAALSSDEAAALAGQDRLVKQFKAADIVVMAYPMHNFGMPGVVKSYFDAVMLNGETFEMGKKLLAGKKSLTLYAAGGQYPQHQVTLEYPNWDTLSLNAKINFGFMGFDQSEVIGASLRDPATAEARLKDAQAKMTALVQSWYG